MRSTTIPSSLHGLDAPVVLILVGAAIIGLLGVVLIGRIVRRHAPQSSYKHTIPTWSDHYRQSLVKDVPRHRRFRR